VLEYLPEGEKVSFSIRFEADGITFEEPSDGLFAFNSPMGACPECEGFGRILGIDEQLVIPNSSLSVYEGAVVCWRGEKMSEWKNEFILRAEKYGFPIFTPYYELTQAQKDLLWHGDPKITNWHERICIDSFFEMLREGQYKIQNRVMLARYKGKTTCPKCHGKRLRPEAEYVKIAGKSITDLVEIPISELIRWEPLQEQNSLTEHEQKIARRLITEIRNRLQFLIDVGLGYLTLNRTSNSLSGGESQRINLATSLGSSLVGSLYILDEPSIGLHSRDTQRLIGVLKQLRDLGNTVVVVEHDEEIMQAADWIIDMGPEAGRLGGEVVYQGALQDMKALQDNSLAGRSHTVQFITGTDRIPVPSSRRPWNTAIKIVGARAHNLKGIDVEIPLHVMTCVTGVSGSGKSSLVRDILYLGMKRNLDQAADRPGEFAALKGDVQEVRSIEFVDQNPIGKSTRSNPVTYIKAWDEIRKLMANLPLSKQMGYTAGFFSFNTDGGRCEECKGEGTVTVEMQFMADLVLECESCHGQRFKKDILDVRFEGKNVNDILQMTVNQAVEFFTEHNQKRIVSLLKPLQDVGLGYIKLGQSSSTLSGGENQRVKLAYFLSLDKQQPTMFIFDEPTTGLHLYDIKKLLAAFEALIARGHTIVIIEHNLDVVKCADHVIDLGPEGGDKGGHLTAFGTPEEVAQCADSYTGQYLKSKLYK
jgi:excinuclease ABC subunit A